MAGKLLAKTIAVPGYDAADYPEDEIMEAMEGKTSYLGGMFNNNVGDGLELRSGESEGWTDSVQACGGISAYIRPRLARNNRGNLCILVPFHLTYI